MRSKLGLLCIFLGILLLCGALSLFLHNQNEDSLAAQGAMEALPQVLEQIPDDPSRDALAERMIPLEYRDAASLEMTEVEINGYAYIGYLAIPSLELNLPILSDWDGARLQIAPCRYHGSVNGENLVLMAHNYASHFGRIADLKAGDSVIFTDMDGVVTHYRVEARDILPPDAVEEMTAGEFDLTLFTCTYGGENRVTVFCDFAE